MGRRCWHYCRSVSRCLSPNPPCGSHRNGLSTVAVVRRLVEPRCGDLVAPVAVPADPGRRDRVQLDLICRDWMPPAGWVGESSADVVPSPVMPHPQHADDSPPGEVVQHAEDVFGDGIFEVVRPAVHDLVEPGQHEPEVLLRCPVCEGTNLGLQRPDRAFADEGVDVLLVRPSFAFPLDAEPEEVEPVAQVDYLGFRSRNCNPIGASTWAISSRSASTCCRVPCTMTTKSSA